jgi:hypothetical protein
MKRVTRRGLIKALGSSVASLGIGSRAVAQPTVKPEEDHVFRFNCFCGKDIVAAVPVSKPDLVLECDICHQITHLAWMEDDFAVSLVKRGEMPPMEEGAEQRVTLPEVFYRDLPENENSLSYYDDEDD